MSARQEVVEAMSHAMSVRWLDEGLENNSDPDFDAEAAVAALSPDLLARLAIESGGLEQVGWVKPNGRLFTVHSDPVTHARETADPDWTPVFRVAGADS